MSEHHCVDCGRAMLPGVASPRCLECIEYYDDGCSEIERGDP